MMQSFKHINYCDAFSGLNMWSAHDHCLCNSFIVLSTFLITLIILPWHQANSIAETILVSEFNASLHNAAFMALRLKCKSTINCSFKNTFNNSVANTTHWKMFSFKDHVALCFCVWRSCYLITVWNILGENSLEGTDFYLNWCRSHLSSPLQSHVFIHK